ncbi:hypothetical protein Anas_05992, partial [Armadillidium nasatum]
PSMFFEESQTFSTDKPSEGGKKKYASGKSSLSDSLSILNKTSSHKNGLAKGLKNLTELSKDKKPSKTPPKGRKKKSETLNSLIGKDKNDICVIRGEGSITFTQTGTGLTQSRPLFKGAKYHIVEGGDILLKKNDDSPLILLFICFRLNFHFNEILFFSHTQCVKSRRDERTLLSSGLGFKIKSLSKILLSRVLLPEFYIYRNIQ